MPRKPAPGARDRLLDTAGRLFYERGVHNVGMQQVIDACGCGKNLLYREFPSKEDLVVAWLERCRQDWVCKAAEATEPLAGDPAAQLVAIVRASADDLTCPGFRGCALHNTHAEFPDPAHPAHQVAVDHVITVRSRLRDLADQAGAQDPDQLADRLMLVLDGLQSNGAVLGRDGPAAAAADLAEQLVRAATRRHLRGHRRGPGQS